MKKYKHSNELLSEIGKMLGGVNVNIKMYNFLKIKMLKIVHFYFPLFLSSFKSILSLSLYEFPFMFMIWE